jgi:hypothetical protein
MFMALWTSNLWMELLPLLRYKYLVLGLLLVVYEARQLRQEFQQAHQAGAKGRGPSNPS